MEYDKASLKETNGIVSNIKGWNNRLKSIVLNWFIRVTGNFMSEELHIVSMYVLILTQKAFFKLGIHF